MKKKYALNKTGMTLIELLIAAAIISILAGIAVFNCQLAISKSKYSAALSDMRAISIAIESYRADNHSYPPAAIGDVQLERPLIFLTTPIAFISAVPKDPFGRASFDINPYLSMEGYNYKDRKTTSYGMPGDTYGRIWRDLPEKEYFLHSCGPNKVWDIYPYIEYDVTNGIVSTGDICRFGP